MAKHHKNQKRKICVPIIENFEHVNSVRPSRETGSSATAAGHTKRVAEYVRDGADGTLLWQRVPGPMTAPTLWFSWWIAR